MPELKAESEYPKIKCYRVVSSYSFNGQMGEMVGIVEAESPAKPKIMFWLM